MTFARAKIQAPRWRPGSIARPALEARLDAALAQHRLVLLIAPAGFGKTAALTRQIHRLGTGSALAWVSCDEDDDLQRLVECLCAGLEPYDPPWRSDPDALVTRAAGTRGQRREAADELLNALAACDVSQGRIVLDDLHRIQDPAVFQFLDLLLPGLPPRWVLVLSTRESPPLALARLRVQGELAEFRESDLQFGADEVDALVQATPGAAARVAAPQLLARTQGWPVGLRLALNTLADGRAGALRSAALDRHVFDYLAAEVLAGMPEDLRRFLLRCAVLPELTAARCEQVSGDARAAVWLDEIEQRGLFVTSLEGPELTLRLHDLFRDFLENRLEREQPDELPQLLRRAAGGESDPVRRIGYLVRAGAIDEAAEQLSRDGPLLMTRGLIAPVLRMIEMFPPAHRDGPRLQLLRGLAAWALWDFDAMCEAMRRAASGFAAGGDRAGEQLALAYEAIALNGASRHAAVDALLPGLLAQDLGDEARFCALHAHGWQALDCGPLDQVAPRYASALSVVERLDTAVAWYQASPVARHLGLPGMVAQMQRFAAGALRHAGEGSSPLRVLAVAMQALAEVWAGRPDEAEALLRPVEDDIRWLGQTRLLYTQTLICRSLLHALRGEATEALAAARRTCELLDDEPDGPRRHTLLNMLLLHEARLAATFADTAALRRCADDLARLPCPEAQRPALAQRALLPVWLADAQRRSTDAIALRDVALRDEALLSRFGMGIETRLRQAAARLAQSGVGAAAETLLPALHGVDDATELAPVLLAGPENLRALAAADWGARLDEAARRRLRHWAELAQHLRAGGVRDPAALPALPGLTEREAEVLARIAAGDSNKLIARALDLSPHTVKRHVANILDKLGVDTRGQAAARARASR